MNEIFRLKTPRFTKSKINHEMNICVYKPVTKHFEKKKIKSK